GRHRLPLPTYPFERQRYWVEPQPLSGDVISQPAQLRKKADIADWFYVPCWKQSPPPELLQNMGLTEGKSRWLVLSDSCGLGSQLVKSLQQGGQDVTTVTVGEGFAEAGEDCYAVNPRRREDYARLLEELRKAGKGPNLIVTLWNMTGDAEGASG